MSAHLAPERALFVVALAEQDPERRAAERHAADCPPCRQLLAEGGAMLSMLDTLQEDGAAAAAEPALAARIERALFAAPAAPARAGWERPAWLLAATVSALQIWLNGHPDRPLDAAIGVHCIRFEQLFALIAFGLTWAWMRRARPSMRLGPLRGSVVAMTGALIGQLLLRKYCDAPGAALHMLLFHGLGVLLASLLGALGGRWLERLRI